MARRQPYFRASLRAFRELWSGAPGMNSFVARFGLWASFPRAVAEGNGAEPSRIARAALLTPEVSYSVLPFSVRQTFNIHCDLDVPAPWHGHPIPRWRGVPCRLGTIELFLLNEVEGGEGAPFSLQVLLPELDPPGPRAEWVFLGEEFLLHYDFRLTVDYPAIRYQSNPGYRQLDSTLPCGSLTIR